MFLPFPFSVEPSTHRGIKKTHTFDLYTLRVLPETPCEIQSASLTTEYPVSMVP